MSGPVSMGEQFHDAAGCDRGGIPHLGPCMAPAKPCLLCRMVRPPGWEGDHAHQAHLWVTANHDGSGRVRVTTCAACCAPRMTHNGGEPCPALLRTD